ncbi:MAG: hypothetical protein R2911_35955 [Caldilineaceae bacterium]
MFTKLFLLNQQRTYALFYAWLLALILHLLGAVTLQDLNGFREPSIFYLLAIYLIPAYFVISLTYTALHALTHWDDRDKHAHSL